MLHLQATVPDWDRVLDVLPAGSLVKAIDQGPLLRQAKEANPRLVNQLVRKMLD